MTCPACGKPSRTGDIHTCTPPDVLVADAVRADDAFRLQLARVALHLQMRRDKTMALLRAACGLERTP